MHVPNFGGVAGSEDFASATLPTTPLNFQGKIKRFCHPTLLKIRFKIIVNHPPPPPPTERKNQNYGASINSNGLLTLSGRSTQGRRRYLPCLHAMFLGLTFHLKAVFWGLKFANMNFPFLEVRIFSSCHFLSVQSCNTSKIVPCYQIYD